MILTNVGLSTHYDPTDWYTGIVPGVVYTTRAQNVYDHGARCLSMCPVSRCIPRRSEIIILLGTTKPTIYASKVIHLCSSIEI